MASLATAAETVNLEKEGRAKCLPLIKNACNFRHTVGLKLFHIITSPSDCTSLGLIYKYIVQIRP